MKVCIFSIVLIAITTTVITQAPHAFNYQAILRDNDGTVRANETVAIQIDILQGDINSPPVYHELHNVESNNLGIINLIIGNGFTSDDFSTIDWSRGPFYISLKLNGVDLGTRSILSVPYALFAESGNRGPKGDPGDTKWDSIAGGINYSQGNVGINTNDPAMKLHVNGSSRINEDLSVGGKIYLSGSEAATLKDLDILLEEIEYLKELIGSGTVIDIDGNIYRTIQIGTQVWMTENLKVTRYPQTGQAIPFVDNEISWSNLEENDKAYCWYHDDISYKDSHGALYTWAAASNSGLITYEHAGYIRGVCPEGWHLPSDEEWKELEMYLGMSRLQADSIGWRGNEEGTKLKATSGWMSKGSGSNESGFTALPTGFRSKIGRFQGGANYWTSTQSTSGSSWQRFLSYDNQKVERFSFYWEAGKSVRCIKDE